MRKDLKDAIEGKTPPIKRTDRSKLKNKLIGGRKKKKLDRFTTYKNVVDEYILTGNAGQSYGKYFPNAKSSSAKTLGFKRIMEMEKVKKYYQAEKAKARKRMRISKNDMYDLLRSWLYSDITQTINLTPKQLKELPEEVRRLITSYEHKKTKVGPKGNQTETETIKLAFTSKEKAADIIAKAIGLYDDSPNVNISVGDRKIEILEID